MYCTKKITDDLTWVGANDRRLAMFEGVYSVPDGVSYNSYLLLDTQTVLFDTVDKAVQHRFLENVTKVLDGRELDYLVVQHMEPDHSAALQQIIALYPHVKVVCNAKILAFIKQFYDFDIDSYAYVVKENDTLNTGRHTLRFIMAPMVHWPEVMVTYDSADNILFSADTFGCFGALNGAVFADEVDFTKDYMDETRRYYANIVGKYGTQVETLLNKAAALPVEMICPLHGFVWRKDIKDIISKYRLWSRYEPEDYGVMLAYASVYGNTENAVEILACRLRDNGIKTVMFDVSVTPASNIVSAAFQWSHLVFASTTYNAGIFVTMEAVINDLTAHNIQNRTAAVIENGSWAAASGGLIRDKLKKCRNITVLENAISIKSSLKASQLSEIDLMADAIIATFPDAVVAKGEARSRMAEARPGRPGLGEASSSLSKAQARSGADKPVLNHANHANHVEYAALFKLTYGLFVLTARDRDKDNGCIINTVTQITESPLRIAAAVNKANFTHDMLVKTGEFNVSILSESVPFRMIKHFGFQSGKGLDKFAKGDAAARTNNGIRYVPEFTNGVISATVVEAVDYDTHTLFIADVTEAFVLSGEKSVTYQYYFDHIKPAPQIPKEDKKGFICKICGYVYEGDVLPDDFICPLCKHGVEDFEPILH
ncbi:MAG: flavin reductase [Peptococcaceae bacterium]|nr:flavin reductase [Peptococcaceae bacterium]